MPAVCHGVERVGPKFGLTHRQVLGAAGQPVDLSPAEAAARIADPAIGWAYLDQRAYCPKLHALIGLRELIVKRPAITTAEPCIGPIRGRSETHLVTGYVHKGYPKVYTLLARHAGFDSALVVRGVEGGVIPSLQKTGRFVYFRGAGEDQSLEIDPSELGIDASAGAVAARHGPAETQDGVPAERRTAPHRRGSRPSAVNPARRAKDWCSRPPCACSTSAATHPPRRPQAPCARCSTAGWRAPASSRARRDDT